jgi:hypothetical protein
MTRSARAVIAIAAVLVAFAGPIVPPEPARASIVGGACGLLGSIGPGWLGKACGVVTNPGKVVGVVKKVLSGKPGQAAKILLGGAGKHVLSPTGAVGIAAIVAWAVGGAHFVLSETAKLVGQSTSPELSASWFSSVYWRVAGVGALLTLPFLIAAAIQAVLRSDGALLARAVFAYLPLAFLATGVAAPLAMMLLQITDWMGATVAGAAGGQGSHFLVSSGVAIGALGVAVGSPFVTFLIALLTAAAGLILWVELLVREAAVYVVVLMLPLVFAAMVWPARRVWAVRSVEVLVALILAKFAIVSVLALAAAALGHGGGSLIVRSLAGLVLVVLGAFAPWVLLRLLPLAEVASAAAGHVREHAQARLTSDAALASHGAATVSDNVSGLMARMQRFNADAGPVAGVGAAAEAARETPEGAPPRAMSSGSGRGGSPDLPAATATSATPGADKADTLDMPPSARAPRAGPEPPLPGASRVAGDAAPNERGPDIPSTGVTAPRSVAEPPAVEDEPEAKLPPAQPDEGEIE